MLATGGTDEVDRDVAAGERHVLAVDDPLRLERGLNGRTHAGARMLLQGALAAQRLVQLGEVFAHTPEARQRLLTHGRIDDRATGAHDDTAALGGRPHRAVDIRGGDLAAGALQHPPLDLGCGGRARQPFLGELPLQVAADEGSLLLGDRLQQAGQPLVAGVVVAPLSALGDGLDPGAGVDEFVLAGEGAGAVGHATVLGAHEAAG